MTHPTLFDFEGKTVDVEEYSIFGHMITAQINLTEESISSLSMHVDDWKDQIKTMLADMLAQKIVDGYCEFTHKQDIETGTRFFKARCFLTKDDQVKVLRHLKNL